MWKDEYAKQWYYKNQERQIQRNREWKEKNRERMSIQKKEHYKQNRTQILKHKNEYHQLHPEKTKAYRQIPEVKARRNEMSRIWRKNNPRSNRSFYPELQEAMNNVRIRDRNTCQWQGCGVTHRQTQIHVHHIFPRSEYPDLELIEQYMICYCPNHHSYWHRMRGDTYSNMIYPSQEYMRANPEELLLGGD